MLKKFIFIFTGLPWRPARNGIDLQQAAACCCSGMRANTLAVYDAWANGHMKRGEWADAITVYERALAAVPGDKHLAHNLAYCRQEQGRAGKTN